MFINLPVEVIDSCTSSVIKTPTGFHRLHLHCIWDENRSFINFYPLNVLYYNYFYLYFRYIVMVSNDVWVFWWLGIIVTTIWVSSICIYTEDPNKEFLLYCSWLVQYARSSLVKTIFIMATDSYLIMMW